MNKKENKRYLDTKKDFKRALLSLLSTKSIFDIKVTELCEEAGYNRTTFYKHYSIPEDVLSEIEFEEYMNFEVYISNIDLNGSVNTLEPLLMYIKDNSGVFEILFANKEKQFGKKVMNLVLSTFKEGIEKFDRPALKPYINELIIDSSLSIILQWIANDFDLDTRTVTRLLLSTIKSIIETAENFR